MFSAVVRTITYLIICMLATGLRTSQKGPLLTFFYAHKGFGNTESNSGKKDASNLTPTRPMEARPVSGGYAKLLARYCDIYDEISKSTEAHKKHDIYARLKGSEICWFIGKLAYYKSFGIDNAFQKLETLMNEYAKSLRPNDLAGPSAADKTLQLWFAPGDSEMDAARNIIDFQQFSDSVFESIRDGALDDSIDYVGFQPEVYQGGEEGFRCKRDANGKPVAKKFDVNLQGPSYLE